MKIETDRALANIGRLVATQDNRITAEPLFLVQQRCRVYGLDSAYCDDYEWAIDTESIDGEQALLLDELSASGRDLPEGAKKVYYVDHWEFVTACFTEAAAQEYIDRNAHNLRSPRIYAATLYRNQEMITIRHALLEIAEAQTLNAPDNGGKKGPTDGK